MGGGGTHAIVATTSGICRPLVVVAKEISDHVDDALAATRAGGAGRPDQEAAGAIHNVGAASRNNSANKIAGRIV